MHRNEISELFTHFRAGRDVWCSMCSPHGGLWGGEAYRFEVRAVSAGAAALQGPQGQTALEAAGGEHQVPSLASLTLELPDTLGPFEADDVRMVG